MDTDSSLRDRSFAGRPGICHDDGIRFFRYTVHFRADGSGNGRISFVLYERKR